MKKKFDEFYQNKAENQIKSSKNTEFVYSSHKNSRREEEMSSEEGSKERRGKVRKQQKEKLEEEPHSIYFSFDLNKNEKVFEVPVNELAYSKEKETDYNCISYLTSARKPDLYVGKDVITAKDYKIIKSDQTEKESKAKEDSIISKQINEECRADEPPIDRMIHIIDRAGKEEDATKIVAGEQPEEDISEKEIEDESKNRKKERRYFDSNDIRVKCYNCDEYGHISKNCPYELIVICFRCNQKGHMEDECPNTKCFKCNRIGHKSMECTVNAEAIEKCDSCKNVGHVDLDCLVKPLRPKKQEFKNSTCYFCGEKAHLICPKPKNPFIVEVYDSDDVVFSESEEGEYSDQEITNFKSETKSVIANKVNGSDTNDTAQKKKKHKRVINYLSNKEIATTIFCPKCAETHKIDECNVQLRFNVFDRRRQLYSKTFFNEDRDNRERNKRKENDYSNDKFTRLKRRRDDSDGQDIDEYFKEFLESPRKKALKGNNNDKINLYKKTRTEDYKNKDVVGDVYKNNKKYKHRDSDRKDSNFKMNKFKTDENKTKDKRKSGSNWRGDENLGRYSSKRNNKNKMMFNNMVRINIKN